MRVMSSFVSQTQFTKQRILEVLLTLALVQMAWAGTSPSASSWVRSEYDWVPA